MILKVVLIFISPRHGNSRKATLLGSIDKTVTPAGGRLLKRLLSLVTILLLFLFVEKVQGMFFYHCLDLNYGIIFLFPLCI